MNRVSQFILAFTAAFIFNSCFLYENTEITFNEEPSVTLANFQEIKEVNNVDKYGYEKRKLIEVGEVYRGESIYTILERQDVSPQTIYQLNDISRGVFSSRSLRPGQQYYIYGDFKSSEAIRLILYLDKINYVVFDWEDKKFVETGAKPVTTVIAETQGLITSSLYESLVENGDSPLLGNNLSEIFGWQIDFFSLQKNDSYKIIYEQQFVDGEFHAIGQIIAANFEHRGESYEGYFYETNDRAGYFNRSGEGLQKALLKAPFKYSQRVSSGFSHNRFHPVLKRNMPHYGVDYAAPLGTPVISVGDGEVIEARYRGPNGNIVKIKHNSVYTTAYLHLNGFAPGIKSGQKVKQGQVIGYVGRTGRVTGVHLDYRIYKNDQPVNPLSISLPPSKALEGAELKHFRLFIERYRFQMAQMAKNHLASID